MDPYQSPGHGIKREATDVFRSPTPPPSQEPPAKRIKIKLERRECAICAEDTAINRFPRAPHENANTHDRGVCFKCWERHLHSEIETRKWNELSCPQCGQILQCHEIEKLNTSFGQKILPEWLEKAVRDFCETDKSDASVEWKECPSASCGWGCYIIKGDGDIFKCHKCEYRHCLACDAPMHFDETCKSFQARRRRREELKKEEELSKEMVEQTSKPCPNCKVPLYKYVGCDHVRCKRCNHEFCYVCFAPYAGPDGIWGPRGNGAHKESCKYSPHRLPSYRPPR
ncbi:Hypothetical predicted protein [Lecanosticta acicola]|uniref:RBR-type E3 ubiquitin transferase n=1 Tax=Lecanosticta acicola TaxID=111012 RepID=A0AAI8Z0V3_9PEZI|nr:Hypothetical predicted protein [Lecanosticta acicola]